jgi:hypothetical protein
MPASTLKKCLMSETKWVKDAQIGLRVDSNRTRLERKQYILSSILYCLTTCNSFFANFHAWANGIRFAPYLPSIDE